MLKAPTLSREVPLVDCSNSVGTNDSVEMRKTTNFTWSSPTFKSAIPVRDKNHVQSEVKNNNGRFDKILFQVISNIIMHLILHTYLFKKGKSHESAV